jgi:hypothetical protein
MGDASYPWQTTFFQAIEEPDISKLRDRIVAAEIAISNRTRELEESADEVRASYETSRELRAISDARRGLANIKVERLHYPDIRSQRNP